MHKKGHKLKTSPLVKNPQFSSNLADIQAKLPTHEAIILTKFHKECKKIVDFLPRQTILLVPFLMHHPSPSWILKAEGVENLILYFELLWNIKQQQVARAKKGLLWMGCVQKMAKWMANNHNPLPHGHMWWRSATHPIAAGCVNSGPTHFLLINQPS